MPAIPLTGSHDATPPRLKPYLHLGTLDDIPKTSLAPRGASAGIAAGIRTAGYEGVQTENAPEYDRYDLTVATLGRVNTPDQLRRAAERWKSAGFECATLHVGWGWERDEEIDQLMRTMVDTAADLNFPLFVETHRATITQDPWRTVDLVRRVPEVRFNGDFSHWYTGSELVYGDIEEKLDRLRPVFQRVRFMHGRVGNSCAMQVPLHDPSMTSALVHYREMWTRACQGFLSEAQPGEYLIFAPELLPSSINYARRYQTPSGSWEEDGDRWSDALELVRIAQECFTEAQRRGPLE